MARSVRRLIALVAVALAAATACESTGTKDSEPPQIQPGVCVAGETKDQGDLVPDLSTIVDCTEPHVYEVYGIRRLPDEALTGSTREGRIANREDLALPSELPDDSTERQAYEEFAERECATFLQLATGYGEVRLRGATAEEAEVVPVVRGIDPLRYSVMPEEEWLEGRRQVVCSARFEDPDHTGSGRTPARPRSALEDRMLITRIGESSFPLDMRQCRGYDDQRRDVGLAPCDQPHVEEGLFHFEADAVFGEKFITRITKRPTPRKFNRFDDVCTDAFAQLLGPDWDSKALRGFGSVARRWTEEHKTVRCAVGPVRFRTTDLPAGSLIGSGAANIDLVRVN